MRVAASSRNRTHSTLLAAPRAPEWTAASLQFEPGAEEQHRSIESRVLHPRAGLRRVYDLTIFRAQTGTIIVSQSRIRVLGDLKVALAVSRYKRLNNLGGGRVQKFSRPLWLSILDARSFPTGRESFACFLNPSQQVHSRPFLSSVSST